MPAGEAAALLRTHADRAETGALTDPAALAAVVGVERLAIRAGTTDADQLRRLLVEAPPELAELVTEVVGRVDEGLARREVGRRPDAGMVNAEAGHHAVSTRAAPLRAAVRAAHATWEAFAYYEARYGGRGARFAGSDSAWLVSLAPLDAEQAAAQVLWLARVLAARGMPSWLLERHLDDLAEEVRTSLGEAEAGALPAAAAALRGRRRAVVEDALLEHADAWVDEQTGGGAPVPRAGALLAAARADVGTGLVDDDASLVDWLTDPARASQPVADALRRVRERLLAETAGGPPGMP